MIYGKIRGGSLQPPPPPQPPLMRTDTQIKFLIIPCGYFEKAIRPLVLTMPKISGYGQTFKVEEGDNKSMSFHVDDEKLLEKYDGTRLKI